MKKNANPSFVARKIRDEMILVPLQRSMDEMDAIYSLNETAAQAYQMALHGADREEITNKISMDFEVDPKTAERDIARILDDLTALGALNDEPPESTG